LESLTPVRRALEQSDQSLTVLTLERLPQSVKLLLVVRKKPLERFSIVEEDVCPKGWVRRCDPRGVAQAPAVKPLGLLGVTRLRELSTQSE
jgi:hypothetical protein